MKHAYRNIYLPNFVYGSGSNEDDAIILCIKAHWAYKKNKNIKTHNNRCHLNGKPNEKKQYVTNEDAPDAITQSGEMYPEAIAYLLLVKDHPMFLSPQRQPAVSTDSAPSMDNVSSTNDDQNGSGDIKDATFHNCMTSEGLFKSRNKQRQEERNNK